MKIAIVGKGGSGKTTLSATLARLLARRGFSVLAIDSDPNPNLGMALGVGTPELARSHSLPRSILEERTTASGETEIVGLAQPIEAITSEYGVLAPDGVTLLRNVQLEHGGEGCLCGEHITVRDMVGYMVERPQQFRCPAHSHGAVLPFPGDDGAPGTTGTRYRDQAAVCRGEQSARTAR